MNNLKYIQLDFLRLYRYGIKNNLIKKKFKTPMEFKTYNGQVGAVIKLLYHQLINIVREDILETDLFYDFEYQTPEDKFKTFGLNSRYTGWVGVIYDYEIEELLYKYEKLFKNSKAKDLKFHKNILKLKSIIDSDRYDIIGINYLESVSLFKEFIKYIKFAKRLKKLSKLRPKLKTFLKEEKAKKKKNVKY